MKLIYLAPIIIIMSMGMWMYYATTNSVNLPNGLFFVITIAISGCFIAGYLVGAGGKRQGAGERLINQKSTINNQEE